MNIFDAAYGDSSVHALDEVKAFFSIKKKDKKEVHKWLKTVVDSLMKQSQQRTDSQRDNLLMYRGLPNKIRSINREDPLQTKRNKKLIIPHIHDLTEVRVSQMTRIKPSVDVLPANGEWEDRASAKVVELIIKHLWYINNIDYRVQDLHRQARIFGESYIFVDWNAFKGDLHPLYVKARDMGVDHAILPDGTKLDLSEPLYTGDVEYSIELPWRVFLQRKERYDDVEYLFRLKVMPVEALKQKYPKADFKETNQSPIVYDLDELNNKMLEDHVMVFEFWHKATPEVPNGYRALFTENGILEQGDHPYAFKGFPCIRLTDLDIPGCLNGVSKYELIAPIFNMYNNINTMMAKNFWMTGQAKWLAPWGSVKIEHLANDNTVVQYKGPVAPTLAQSRPNPPEAYQYVESLLRQGQAIYGNHGISRGEIPTGITATSALTYLNELESQRASTDISKHSTTLIDLAKITMAIIGDKYAEDDGRVIRIVGADNQYFIRHFDNAHLHKDYDIRFNVGSGLPDTKAGKRQIILDMMQRNPTGNTMERWEELLEIGNVDKAIDLATAAIKCADSENEDMAAGRPVAPPEAWEDHVVHLQSHYRFMQTRQYKEEMNLASRKEHQDHVYWTEKAALLKAETNPQFEALLAGIPLFPLFVHEGFQMPRSYEQQAAVAQGIANKEGSQAPGVQIPGTPLMEVR